MVFDSLTELSSKIRRKQVSCVEVCRTFLDRITERNGSLNAYLNLNERLLDEAKVVDARLASGETIGPLAGIPLAIKDIFCVQGMKTTAGSRMLKDFSPPYTATCVSLLERAGALVIGKTNLDEFGMGSSNENSAFGPVANPWNEDFVAGGSSGGSAAAVAAGLAPAALGSDTGGSIRLPAHFCGLVGVKPTYGRISRYGLIAHASSLDQAGPITRRVADAALLTRLMSGKDRMDQTTSILDPEAWEKDLHGRMTNYRVAVVEQFEGDFLDDSVARALREAETILRDQGAEIVRVSIPEVVFAVPTYYLVSMSEAASNLSRYDGIRFGHRARGFDQDLDLSYCHTRAEGFGDEVRRRILVGTFCLSSGYYDAYYKKASQLRRLLLNRFKHVFESAQIILAPVAASPAFALGAKSKDPLAMYQSDMMTTPASLCGFPAMSVPVAISPAGLPVGVQLVADHFHEADMLNAAQAIETHRSTPRFVPNG